MLRLRFVVPAVVVIAVVAVLAVRLTGDSRAAGARAHLVEAAGNLERCFERTRSYASCQTGVEAVMTSSTRRSYEVLAAVEFGPTYSISRRGTGARVYECYKDGEACPTRPWSRRR